MHAGAIGRTREERVAQVRAGTDPSIRDASTYVPVDGVVAKLRRWYEQGAEIEYLTANRDPGSIAADEGVLERHRFPPGRVLARGPGETYGDVAARAAPDVLIEDDCESVGGAAQMTHPQLPPELRERIASIVVQEFGGHDHLPDSPERLLDA
jgi:hypothetical protein